METVAQSRLQLSVAWSTKSVALAAARSYEVKLRSLGEQG